MDSDNHLRNELIRDSSKMCINIGKVPSVIIVSGDIAYGAAKEEYAFATTWLEKLAIGCGTNLESVFVVPGNHDINRDLTSKPSIQSLHRDIKAASLISRDAAIRGLLVDSDSNRLLYKSLDQYNLFAGQFFCDLSAPERTIAKRDLKLNDGSIVKLWGLNSTFVSSKADDTGDLFVDPAYNQIIRERGVEHITICHHPYEWLRNGNTLKDHLNDVTRMQLFGHEHTNRIELNRDYVRIAASATHPDRTEPGWEPGYNLIEIQVSSTESKRELLVDTHVRIWQSNPGQFRAKMDGEKGVFQHKINLESWKATEEGFKVEKENVKSTGEEPASQPIEKQEKGGDPMDSLRNISVKFFKLNLSQKSAIAGKLNLMEEEDINQPDFERFRRVFVRAKSRNLIEELDREVSAALRANKETT